MRLRKIKKNRPQASAGSAASALASLLDKGGKAQRRGDLDQAISCYTSVLRLSPNNAFALHELGLTYNLKGELAKAESYYRLASSLDPEMASAHYNLGNLLVSQGKIVESLACYQRAVQLEPENVDALSNIGVAFYELGQMASAIEYFQKALAINPDSSHLHSISVSALHYLDTATSAEILQSAKQWWLAHGRPLYRKILHRNAVNPTRKLKVGYISPDFREHSIYYFITPLLKAHDRSRFDIFCYADINRPDWATEEIKGLSDHWRDITHASDEAVALNIERDGIDLLIDLAGHMTGNRLCVFAQKPAPVQISWLGYPGTTGLPTIDYRLVDTVTDPPGEADQGHSEELIRLPGCFLCYQPPAEDIDPGPPPSLRTGTFTFGSFNNPAKMNPTLLTTWATILRKLPNSHLLLKGKHLNDCGVQNSLLNTFTRLGIDTTRICFSPHLPSRREHLTLYNGIDLCLDTFPYNGTTTTLEALWMGVPVLTLRGDRHASRVGASILQALGRPELITDTQQSYIDAAIRLASDPLALAPRGASLRGQLLTSPLCATRRFAEGVESAYKGAWQKWEKTQHGRALSSDHPTT
ncbi:MAG: tetratricopeptide repeat protein [Desulfobulbaceae bacterium]|nr:tetratricopeptide repeat protein [Desulfobulbaceae bacterium]